MQHENMSVAGVHSCYLTPNVLFVCLSFFTGVFIVTKCDAE